MHASPPHGSFNALLRQELAFFKAFLVKQLEAGSVRADLRQTPGELQGKPFQCGAYRLSLLDLGKLLPHSRSRSYVMLSASVEAPCPSFVTRRLRLLRARGQDVCRQPCPLPGIDVKWGSDVEDES